MKHRQINAAGLELIKRFEGLRLSAYKCPAGVWTIGYGSTGPHVRPGMTITPREATELLQADLLKFERAVAALVTVTINENQFSALVSFAFNVGEGALARSTLLKHLNAGRIAMAAQEFLRWTKAGGVELPGLVRRRQAERDLFSTPPPARMTGFRST